MKKRRPTKREVEATVFREVTDDIIRDRLAAAPDPHREIAAIITANAKPYDLQDLAAVAFVAGETLAKLLRRREVAKRWGPAESELNELCGRLTHWQLRPDGLTVDAWTRAETDFARGIASLDGADLAAIQAVGHVLRKDL